MIDVVRPDTFDGYGRYSQGAMTVLSFASQECRYLGHHALRPEHLLLGLLHVPSGASQLLASAGLGVEQVRSVVGHLSSPPGLGGPSAVPAAPPLTPEARRVFDHLAPSAALADVSGFVDPEHVLLGLLVSGEVEPSLESLRVSGRDLVRRLLEAAAPRRANPDRFASTAIVTALESQAATATVDTIGELVDVWASLVEASLPDALMVRVHDRVLARASTLARPDLPPADLLKVASALDRLRRARELAKLSS